MQIFNCGVYACAVAARLGKDIIEVIVNGQGNLEHFVNGKATNAGSEVDGINLDSTLRHIVADHFDQNRRPVDQPGSCIDDPGGQIMLDFVQSRPIGSYHRGSNRYNLNVHLVAQSDAVTTKATNGNAFCNELTGGAWTWSRWDSLPIPVGESLFVSTGTRACEGCNLIGWGGRGNVQAARNTCNGLQGDLDLLRLDRVCAAQDPPIAIADAERPPCMSVEGMVQKKGFTNMAKAFALAELCTQRLAGRNLNPFGIVFSRGTAFSLTLVIVVGWCLHLCDADRCFLPRFLNWHLHSFTIWWLHSVLSL